MAKSNRGNINFQDLKAEIGFTGKVNPIARATDLRPELIQNFEVRNRQQFVNRYQWCTLDGSPFPEGIDPDLIERILYYRYNLIAFFFNGKFYTCPFALNGGIDVYGRYTQVSPLTFNGSINYRQDNATGQTEEYMSDGDWITDLKLAPSYDIYDIEPIERDGVIVDRCVILQDFENGIAQKETNRYVLSQAFEGLLADTVALIRHNLVASARIFSYRVLSEDQKNTSLAELENMEEAVLENGQMFFPVTSSVTLETVFDDKELDEQSYWECFVSIDNLRENLMGIENNGIFKKKERELSGEADKEASQADLIYQDGLHQRQKFCEIFDAVFGQQLWCMESPSIDKVDVNDDNYSEGEEENEDSDENVQ